MRRITASASSGGPGSVDCNVIGEISDETPIRLEIGFTNRRRGNEFSFGYTPPLSRYQLKEKSSQRKLILGPQSHPDWAEDTAEQVDDCWQTDSIPMRLDAGKLVSLDSLETVSEEYDVVNWQDNDDCYPTGSYSISDEYEVDQDSYTFTVTIDISE